MNSDLVLQKKAGGMRVDWGSRLRNRRLLHSSNDRRLRNRRLRRRPSILEFRDLRLLHSSRDSSGVSGARRRLRCGSGVSGARRRLRRGSGVSGARRRLRCGSGGTIGKVLFYYIALHSTALL